MTKETLTAIGMNVLVCALFACIPLGLFLAYWFDNGNWLWLCATLLIFLS